MQRGTRRFRFRWLVGAIAVLAALAVVPSIWERAVAAPFLRGEATAPDEPVALVFGAKVYGDQPSSFLAARLDLAAGLYTHGRVRVILVSGDNGSHSYDEPDVMRTYLVMHGVPAGKVVVDYAGFDTWDTCARARRIFGVSRAIVVTQTFHVLRAVALCRANGIDAYGVGADSAALGASQTAEGYAREFVAAGEAMWESLVSKPDPRFLGRQEPGVAQALASVR